MPLNLNEQIEVPLKKFPETLERIMSPELFLVLNGFVNPRSTKTKNSLQSNYTKIIGEEDGDYLTADEFPEENAALESLVRKELQKVEALKAIGFYVREFDYESVGVNLIVPHNMVQVVGSLARTPYSFDSGIIGDKMLPDGYSSVAYFEITRRKVLIDPIKSNIRGCPGHNKHNFV